MATNSELGITEPGFTEWGAVVDSPEYQNTSIQNRLGAFQNWSDYSKGYFQKKLEEAPDNAKPEVEEKLRKLETWTSEKSDFLKNKYDLGYRVSKLKTSEEVISALRDPDQLRKEGFSDDVIFGLRKEVEKEFAPILVNARAGTETEESAARLLWEEPGVTDTVANFANRVIPTIASLALKTVEGAGNLASMFKPDSEVYAPGFDTQLPFKEVAELAGKGADYLNKNFPADPRLSSDVVAASDAIIQVPFNLATAALGTVPNAASNYSQMYQENLDTYTPQITKRRYEEEVKAGQTSASTPFKQWESLLSEDDKKDIRAEAATKAMLFAIPQAAVETLADKFLLNNVPLPTAVKSKLMAWRNARPTTYIGARVATNFLGKTGVEAGTEVVQQGIGNIGGATNTGDWSRESLTEGFRESAIGGAFGGGGAAALMLPNTFRTERAIDWSKSILNGLDQAAQQDIAVLKDPNADINSPEYKAAYDRALKKDRADYQHQFDLAFVNDPNAEKDSVEYRNAEKRIQTREDEANWILLRLGDEKADKQKAARYQAVTGARKDFENAFAKHVRDTEPEWVAPDKEFQTRAREIRASFDQVRKGASAVGSNLDVDAAEKLALEQLVAGTSEKAERAAKLFNDFIGSLDSEGPGRAAFARQEIARLYPNSTFSSWWSDDATVTEVFNAREKGEIDDKTDLDAWLASPAGIKATTSETKQESKATTKPEGLLTSEDDLLQAFYMAEDNVSNSDDASKKELSRLWERISKLRSVLENENSSEERKTEALERLPELESALLALATNPNQVSSRSTNPNDQNQTSNQASVSSQEVPPTSAVGQGTGTGEPFTVVRTFDGEEKIQTEQDYINESRGIVTALLGTNEAGITMTPDQALQNVEAVRQEIEAAPDLTPEQKTQWASHFQNIPALVEQQRAQQTTPNASTAPAAASGVSETTESPELIAGEGTISQQPTPVRMNSVPGDVLRTETGEVVFRSTADNTETVLRVKEGSIDKDPAALTVEDFEGGDGTPLVSEAKKQFSVLPETDRPVRPFFRSAQQPTITPQDGPTATSSGSYPEDAGSTPAPATPAIDTAAITAEVQASPDAHRRTQGRSKQVSREAAVAILTQLPENLTRKDAISIGSTAGMSRPGERVLKLAALRNDPNAVASILNGDMDAELGLFDRNAEPTAPATTEQGNDTPAPKAQTEQVSNDTTEAKPAPDATPAAETVGQGTVDRFVYNLMAAFDEALPKMNESNLKVMAFRERMRTPEGRAETQRKLAGMAQTSIFAGIRSKGILDPVVEQEMAEKALYGSVSSANTGELTKNVQQDLLNNLAKTGDPFLTTNKDGDLVSYNAWFARGRNLVDRYIKAQNKRDKGTKNSEGEQESTDVENEAPAEPEENAVDPEESFKREQYAKMKQDAIREVYDKIAQRISKESGYSLEDSRLALLHHISEKAGVTIDPVPLGWKAPDDNSRVKQKLLKALEPKFPEIFKQLGSDMRKGLKAADLLAEEQGLLSAPVIDPNNLTLESIIGASVYDEIVNGQAHKAAIAKAREQKSTSPLMPLLAEIGRKDVANVQSVVQSVLNNGKPFSNGRDITALTQSDMQKVLDSGLLPARIQETLQALVDLSGDGMALLRNSDNEGWRVWSNLLSEQLGNREPVQVVFNLALDPTVTGQGLWQEGTNTVHISPFLTREKGLMESTLLHEMMHPVWDWKVTAFQRGDFSQLNEKETAALTELEFLRNLVKMEADKRLAAITDPAEKAIAERNLVGADDLREFLNEAINHKPFQDFLAGLKDPDAKNKGGLLRRIVNAILRLIRGGTVAEDSILQRSFELSLDLANYTDRELPIAERNKTQVEHFKNIEAQLGRALTPDEIAREAINFEVKYPQPRIANTRAEASRLGSEGPAATELGGFLTSKASMGVSDQDIFDAIKANGGITIDVWTAGQPGTGIVVAPFKETETKIPLNNFTPQDVNDFMEKFRPLLEVPGMHLGGWISDDTVYLDVSIVTDDEVTATALAEDGNQLATYNIGTGEFPSTPELLGRNSGAVSRLRAEARYQNLAGSLQQAFRRALGGIQGADNRNVPAEGAFPELGVVEALTGEPPTQDEINDITKSIPVGTGASLQETAPGVGPESGSRQVPRQAVRPNAEPNPFVKEGIRGYNSTYGIAPAIEGHYAPINEQRARSIAAAYEALPVFDNGKETQEAYGKLAEEIQQQWEYAINQMGVTFEPWVQEGQPYANSREMVQDVRDNKHLWFFTGGEPHPLLNEPDADGLTMNDKLRAIHDLFGHAAEDYQFGARGEENAWIKHSQMFSPMAQRALTTETRGQNSWVNFGPLNYNEDGSKKSIPASERPFAVQKVALLPEEFMDWEGALSSTLASRKVGPDQYLSSATDEVYNFPAPNEYFPNAEAVRAYVEKKFKPQAKALNSRINDSVLAREAAYIVVGQQGRHYIEFNPVTMTQNTRSEVDAIMREEMVHCATGLVLQRKGIEWQDFYEDLGESLSPQQRQRLKGVYRSTRNNMDVGAEYFRAAIQQLLYGRITEAERKTSPMKKILSLIMDFVNYFRKGEVDPVVREVYEDSVRILQKVDKKNAAQDVRFSEPVPASETLGKLWQEAAAKEGGDAFAYGEVSPSTKNFADVFKSVLGDPSKNFSVGYYNDGSDVTAEEWENLTSNKQPSELWVKDPDKGVTVFFSDKDSAPVGIYAVNSTGTKNQGSALYQSFYAWAHNNGKIVGPDSSLSKIGQLRRTSQMLSSALRFGTTQHMRPSHEQEIKGWRYVEADSEGQYWEISNELRPGKTVEDLFKNPYNRFNQEVGIAEFYEPTDGASDPGVYKSNWEGYSLTARRVSPEEAQQAWSQNIGLLAQKEAQIVFERNPELGRLSISKDGYLFGPDEEYPGSTRALPAGNTDEYLGTLVSAIRKADPEFTGRIGAATLARALATRFSETNSANPTLLSSDAEGSSPSGQLQLNTFSPYTKTLYSGPVGPEKVLSTIDQVLDLPEPPEAVETSEFEGGKVRSIAKIFAKTLGAKNRISFGDVEGKKATAKISSAGDRVFEVLRRAAYEFPNFASWYESRLKMALQIFTELDPDVANKNNQSALLVALAVTSNGADVATQTEDAWDSYKYWKQSGRLAGAPNKRGAMRGGEVEEKLALADELAKKIGGYEKLGEFLNRKATVAELRAALQNELGLSKKEAEKITNGELVDEVVPFSLIFGAKLGSFFNNMSGDFSTITMDRWFMRTFGRTMGTQLSTVPKEVIETKKTRLGSALKEYEAELLKNAGIEDVEADPEKTAAALSQSILKQAGVREGTKDLVKVSVLLADYFVAEKNRKGLSEKGHELRRAANALSKVGDGLELNEAPDGGSHRRWIRAVMADAINKFNQQTEKPLVPAEAQALLWYYEKLVHETYGSRQKDSSPDYGSGANRLYIRERGTQSPSYRDSDGIKRRSGGGRSAAFGGDQTLPATGESREGTLASRPVQFQAAPLPGFNPTVYTSADRRQTTALSRVLSDPEYQGIRDALGGKQYISYTEGETIAKATEFINNPANNGDLQTAFRNAGNSPGLTAEQVVVARGLVIQRAQQAANKARAAQADSTLSIQTRNNMGSLAEYYQGQADSFADDLMSQASLAGQELRAFRVLADALVPQTWVKRYKDPVVKAQKKKMENDPVFKEMLERIKVARQEAANSTTVRMQKALDIAAKRFVKDSSVEEVQAYDNFARLMASNLPVREEVMQAATEMVVVSGIETIRKAVAPGDQIDPAFLKQWENKLRTIASQQLNEIIDSRLQGGKVDEAASELTEAQKEAAREQKIMDAWRDFSDFPIAEMVFNLARSTIVASDSPYAALVRKAQFDPEKIKRLQQAVKMSINTAEEIRKSVAERGMSVESLKLRLQEANPTLSDTELGALADAVKAVYDSEVQRASASALQNILRTGKRDPRKLTDASTISKLLPLVNMGAFKEEEVYNALADKFNLPTWSQETADAIEKLANEVQSLPEGSVQRGEAGQRMMLEILRANIKDSRGAKRFQHFNQIASAVWTAGILSGPSTQIVNIAGTTASVFLEAAAEATGYFIEAKKRGVSTAQAAEFYKDIARAWLFAFGKDANNVSVRAMNEAHTSLTRGASRFKAEKQEDLATLELFKHDPRLAIPGNAFMEAITTGQWRDAAPAAFDLGLGIAKTVTERAIKRDAKGAVKDYLATLKMVGRGMLAADAVNSFTASSVKQIMVKRMLMQMDGLTDAEVNRRMKEIRKGGEVSVVEAAKAQAEQEAANGDFGKTGTTEHRINKARRVEQLIEQLTYGGSVIEQGRNFAADATFNGEPTGIIGAVMMGTFGNLNRVLGLAARPINPFPKTISNLLNRSLDYTVYGYLRAQGKNAGSYIFEENSKYYKAAPEKGSPEYFAAHAKATAGTIALATFAMMLAGAVKDRREKKEPFFEIHGPGPKDPKFRSQWAQSGNKAFSLRIGKLELRYTDWPGINIPLGVLGTIYDNLVYGDQEAEAIDQLFTGVASVIGTTLDRNMLGGASALFDILSKNTYEEAKQVAFGKFVSSYTGGFLKPSFIRYLETIGTGGYQDARGTQGWLLSQLPFVGATGGNPALNVLGEPIKISAWDATAGRLVSMADTHPILTPLTNAELAIPKPEAYQIYDPSSETLVRPMEAQEFYDFSKLYGQAMRERLTPEFVGSLAEMAKTAPQGAQDILNSIALGARNQAQAQLAAERQAIKGKELKGP